MGRSSLLVFLQSFLARSSGDTHEKQIYSPSGPVPGLHPLLYQDPWIPPCGKGYAEVFQGLSTLCTPDGAHPGEQWTDQENTWSGAINIPVGAT